MAESGVYPGLSDHFVPCRKNGMLKLSHETLNDRAYAALRQGLISGTFNPGQTLVIRKLADLYGISTTPIREALQRLVAERALEMKDNRSIIVPLLSETAFDELTDLRIAVEGTAGERAASRMPAVGLAEIRALVTGMDRAIKGGDPASYLAMNEAFHFAIYNHADAPIMLNIIQDLWGRVGPYLNLLMHSDAYIPQSNVAHRKIVAALEQGNGLAVRTYLEEDIRVAASVLLTKLKDKV